VEPGFPGEGTFVAVLKQRWIKHLCPQLPNFQIPEMVEKHDRFNPVETSAAGYDTDLRRAFIGAAVGGLYCLDLRFGETVWRYDLGDAVGSTPLYDPGRKRVYFGADDGRLYALHARSGRRIWSVETGAEIRGRIHLHDDTLFLANADNTVLAVDPEDGQVVWRYRRPPLEGFSAWGYADVALSGTRLYAAMADGTFACLEAISGELLWNHDLSAEAVAEAREGTLTLYDADATPVVVDGVAVAASLAGGMVGVDAETGSVRWTRPDLSRVTGLAADHGVIYATLTGGGLLCIDPRDGALLWRSSFGRGVQPDPVPYDDVLLIADSEAGLFVVSNADGRVLQRLDQKEGFFARPSTHGGFALVLGNRGTLFAFAIR
jgi:outer membrane protein assembly factor BamB